MVCSLSVSFLECCVELLVKLGLFAVVCWLGFEFCCLVWLVAYFMLMLCFWIVWVC